MNKPVFLCDLDDTLFQTRRKMVDELDLPPFRVGALDRSLTPRSFMTESSPCWWIGSWSTQNLSP